MNQSDLHTLRGLSAALQGNKRNVLEAFIQNYPKPLTTGDLINSCFSHRKDGGPEASDNNVRTYLHRLRRVLERAGFDISYGQKSYRLVKKD